MAGLWKQSRARLHNLLHRGEAERDLEREIASHLRLLEDEFARRGLSTEEARLAAKREYGGVEQAKELHRDERSFAWMEQTWQDLRHACRSLVKSRGFAVVAVLSLAFGIGVNTSIFTLVNGILLKTLPVSDPGRVVQLGARLDGFESTGFSYPVFRRLRSQDSIFEDAIGFTSRTAILDFETGPQRIEYQMVSGSFFAFFRAVPLVGRLLDEEDDRVEAARPGCWHPSFRHGGPHGWIRWRRYGTTKAWPVGPR